MSAVIQNEYTGNNSTTQYPFTFPYLKTSDIKSSLDGVATTAFTLPNATTLQFNTAPANGAKIKIFRETSVDELTATFYAGSAIKSEDLNDNFTQNLYKTQEVGARSLSTLGGTMTGDLNFGTQAQIVFEGATDDAHETTLAVTDPTADRTITLPNVTGTVVTTGDTGTVATGMIAADAVTGAKIADDSIDSEHYVDGSIDTAHIADLQVTTGKIAADAITSAKIADDAIGSEHYADNSINTAHIGDGQVTTAKLATDAVTTAKITDANVTAAKLASDSVTTAKIADNAVTQAKMADDSVGAAELVDGSVGAAALAANAVTNAKVADDAIGTSELVNDAVTTVKIADNAVTMAKLSSGTLPTDISIASANIPDSTIVTTDLADNAVSVSKIADAELKTLSGMQSATASKLADSTALTADIADLNQIDGLTKQTTISDSDASFPTSGAVVDYVAAQLAPLGGFEAIANEQSFPNTQPSAGVVISIADAGGLAVSSSGTASGQTVGGTTVNITGIASNFNSTTVSNGVRFLVASTGSGQNYTYHKATLNEDDLVSLSGDINDFAERYRVGSSNPTTALDNGDLFFNTSTGKMLVYNGTNTAWEEVQSIGNFFISTLSPAFDGTTQNFTITNAPSNVQQVLLVINGVVQKPNAGTNTPSEGFALDGSTIKLGAAPATGSTYHAVVLGSTVNIGTPSNNTVTSAILQNGSVIAAKIGTDAVTTGKIADSNVTTAKIADEAVTLAKLPHGTSSNNGKFLRANNGADPTFESVITDVVGDTSPQLGGDLDANGNNIAVDGGNNITIGDNGRLRLGNSQDLDIYHDGSDSYVNDTGTGNLYIVSTDGNINLQTNGSENAIKCIENGAVELYHNNVKKLETASNSVILHDELLMQSNHFYINDNAKLRIGTGQDLQIYHDGTNSVIDNDEGHLMTMVPAAKGFRVQKAGGQEDILNAYADGAVSLYYDSSKKLETTSAGVTVTGAVTATSFAGDGSALTGLGGGVPTGCILLWSGAANAIPSGYTLCNGSNSTPDLRDRFVVGAQNAYSVGDTGGANSVTLTTSQIPSHTHNLQTWNASGPANHPQKVKTQAHYLYSNSQPGSFTSESTGGGGSHENRPPYYALCYIMKT